MTLLRVAAGQAASVAGDLAVNVATAVRLTDQAASQEVRLLVLPEAFLTGYDADAFAGPLPDATDLAGPWLQPLRDAATRGDVTVVVSAGLVRGGTRVLAQVVLRPGAAATAPYDKQHLDGLERTYFTPGDHGSSIEVDGHGFGLSVCYDGSFPEHARAAAEDGAIGYLNSAAWFAGSGHRRDVCYPARALENGMYVVLAALTGRCGAFDFIGGSAIYDPEGRPLARLGEEEGLATADLDPTLVASTRATHTMLADHRATLGPRVRA